MPRVKSCIKKARGVVELADVDVRNPADGEALIRTTLTTICGSDLHIVDELDSIPAGLPQGHEAVGVVEAIGAGVQGLKPGDRVVASCVTGCGSCALCAIGDLQLCRTYRAPLNLLFGCQSEAFVVRSAELNVAKIPDGIEDRQAVLAADVMSTGFAAIERGQLKPGQSVAIFAQGPIGLCATAAAKHYGASRIIAVESIPERMAMAKRLGADEVLLPEGAAERILELTSGGVDLAVEAVGKPASFEACLQSIRIGGTVSVVGVFTGVQALKLPINARFCQHTIVTSYCPGGSARLQYLIGLMERDEVDLTPLLTHEKKLSEIAAAYDLFRHRKDGAIKIALTP